jgi:hypothetical protein
MSFRPRPSAARGAPPIARKAFRPTVRRAAKPVTPKGDHDDSTTFGEPSALVDLPDPIPVTAHELDVLERYLGAAVDALFSDKPASQ